MKAHVTGASGYIGSVLCPALEAAGASRAQFDDADVWFDLEWQTDPVLADADPAEDRRVTVERFAGVLNQLRHRETKPFVVFPSSVTVVGSHSGMICGTERDCPETTYDLHKLMAEEALLHACRRGWVRGTVLRLSNVYGPSPRENGANRGVLNAWARQAAKGEPITVYGSGDWKRDYLYIDDAVRAFIAAAENQDETNGKRFVVGSWLSTSLCAAACTIAGLTSATVTHVDPETPLGAVDRRSIVVDYEAFHRATGWKPRTPFDEGVRRLVAHELEKLR